ncbi:ADGRL2 [Branchiostoma lanceolatum]|uniref:ADGRL2 protein n=1 Tax=Branchiostoma lanceolatum TaxID=7740 RepID=A0A8J9YXJ4_BRALA|nr:ADGRL2 [Branchiostoma lanceolatum]
MGDRGIRLTSAWNDASPASHVRLRAVLCVLILPVSLFPTFTSGSCAGSPCLNNGTCVPVTSSSSHHSSLPVRLRCPEGWIRQGGSCYKFHINDRKSWEEARQTCREESSELVSIETLEENRFLRALTVNGLYQGSLDECPANNTLFYNNKTYTASLEKLTQSQASQVCQGKGGHLVAPKDAESYARVVFLKNCLDRTEQFWLGLMFDEVNGRWVFSDGTEASGFQSWAPGEPNNKSRLCSYIVRGNRGDSRADQWADAYCDQFSFSYVCEVDGDVSGDSFWTSGTDETSEGVFKWNATGRNVTADGWKEGEPNGGRNENCIELRKQHNFLWNDARCEHRNFFICEIGTQNTWAVEPEWTDKDADYQCRCQPGYSGELCDVPPEEGALPEVTMTCEGQVMRLSCSSLTRPFIYVEYASYGRTGMGCGGISDNFSLNCSAQDALQIVRNRCNGLPECSMIAGNDNFGGDPCPGTLKYLEVRMKCVAGPPDGYAPAPTGLLTSFHTDLPPTTVTATSGPPITNVTVNSTTSEYATTMDVNVTTSPLPSGATMSTESRCPATRKRNILWPETARGVWSSQPCPNGTVGSARWYCEGPMRKGEPDLSNCTSPWVNELYDLLNAGGPAGDILALISGNLISQGTVYGGDVIRSIDLLNVLVQRQEEQLVNMTEEERKGTVTSFTQTMTLCGSTLLRSDIGSAWDDIPEDNWSQVATGVIDSAEGSGFLVAKSLPDETFSSVQDNLVLEVLPATGDSRRFPSGLSSEWNDVTDSVSLPATNQQVVALLYNDSLGTYLKPKDANRTVNSRVISASLGNGSTSGQLGDNQKVTIVLQHTNAENASVRNPTCSFWNFSNGGSWSSKGCTKTKESNETHTICECDHLTNFAILMDISGQGFTEADRFALSIITWVGCIISIVCLVFAICIFLGSRRVRCQRTVIHANLCICLLLAEALFLAGVDKTEDKVACEVIAVVLHYLFLASFTWMCLEGVQLYILLIKVFKTQRSRMVYFYLFGYGVPAVMVGVSVAVNFSDNLNGYVTDRYCWLNAHKFFIWSFVGPALLIVLINFGFLIIALRVVYSHKSGKKMKHFKTGTKFKSWIRGSLTLLCLLGVTWVFGVLYLDSGTIVFAYVFAITNSLQGMFIFIFHCLLNEKVQGELIRCFAQCACCPEFLRQKYLERGSGTYVHHSGQSHRLHQNTLKTDSSGSTTSTRLNNTLDNHKVPLAITNGIKRRNVDVAIPGHHSALAPVESKPFEKGSYYPHPGYREPHPGYREFSHSWEMTSLPEKKHPASPYRGEVRNGTVNFQIDI